MGFFRTRNNIANMVGVEVHQVPSEAEFEVWPVCYGWGPMWNCCGAWDRVGEQSYVFVKLFHDMR